MEKLFPGAHDFAPLLKNAADIIKQLSDVAQHVGEAVSLINTALYVNGLLTGITLTATLLTAIHAFSRK